MIRHICKTAPLAALVLGSTCFGYVTSQTNIIGDTSPAALFRTDNTGIQFYLNAGVVPGVQSSASGKTVTVISANSDPVSAVRAALATWNGANAANIQFKPLQSTSTGINSTDNTMVIALGASPNDLSMVGPALALTVTSYVTSSGVLGGVNVDKGAILDTDIIINPAYAFSTDGSTPYDLQSVMLHEFGHSLGANHSGLMGASMFQFPNTRFLTTDDLAFATSAYAAAGAPPFGTIAGSVSAGGAGVPFALLTAFDTSSGVTVGSVTNPDGTYSFQVPPGNYRLYAEPLNGAQTINIYLSAAQVALAGATKFQTTMYSGNLNVTANGTATANIAVTPGAATLATPYMAISAVNGYASSLYFGGPVTVPSGQAVDLSLYGAGFDGTLNDSNFAIYGKGLTLHAGSVRVDKSSTYASFNLLRVTLDVAATTTPTLASFMVTTAAGTISFSGSLVIVPPTPTFVPAAVISAAPYVGIPAGVSPGGLSSIYDPATSSLGPVPNYLLNGPYDAYGNIAALLGGVSVTFDGVPAPMTLSYGPQINFQVPFEVAGKATTKVVVNYLGSSSATVSVPVLAVEPQFFTSDGKAVRAYNLPGYTINSAQNPAPKGSYVEVYGTGVGKVNYAIATGHGAPALPAGYTGNYTYSIGGSPAAAALFGGWTPTAVGLAQWDVQIPATGASGAVPILVTDPSGVSSRAGTTIFVQ